jgi:hypothetical protein
VLPVTAVDIVILLVGALALAFVVSIVVVVAIVVVVSAVIVISVLRLLLSRTAS